MKKIGKKGTKKRGEFEAEFEAECNTFRLGVLIQQAREPIRTYSRTTNGMF